MKRIIVFLGIIVSVVTNLFAQDHIPISHTIPHDTSRICWGYAMGRAGGKYDGNETCNPVTLIPNENAISSTYFNQYDWSQVNSLQAGDILYWPGTHAAYVVSVPRDGQGYVIVDNITVDHTAAAWTEVYHNDPLPTAKQRLSLGNPTYFCRKKPIQITVQNSFGGGTVNVAGSTVASGGVSVNWWHQIALQALNQQYQNIFWNWNNWQKSGEGPTTQNPRTITAASGDYYTANFTGYCDITGSNSLPGASGGTISIWDTVRNSGTTVRIQKTTSLTITAINQQIDRVYYTFSSWSGDTSGSNSSFTSTAWRHKSYTANFTAKPLQAENCYAGGVVGNPVQITWTQHPNANVTYKIYRKVKPLGGSTGSETLIASLGNSTTSYTDYDYLVTSTYSDDLLSYDVRSYLNGVYSDPNFVQVFGEMNPRQVQDGHLASTAGELPTSYTVSNYPNPFNPSTTISYQLVEEANVTLEIYDMMGRKISSLVQEPKQAGYHTAKWEGKDNTGNQVATGVYLYRFSAIPTSGKQPFTKSGKLLLTK